MKAKRITGYVIGFSGLVLLLFNAFVFLTASTVLKIPAGIALAMCVVGALLIRMSEK